MTAAAIPSLTAAVTVALADPEQVLSRLALFDSAEQKDRHTAAGLSILRYALERYVASNIDLPDKYTVKIEATDESIIVTATNKSPRRAKTDHFEQEIAYPVWLASFFADDEHFDLLLPESDVPLEEGLTTLRAHVAAIQEGTEEDDDLEDGEEEATDDEDEDPDEEADEDEEDYDDEEYEEEEDDEDEDEDEDEETAGEEEINTPAPVRGASLDLRGDANEDNPRLLLGVILRDPTGSGALAC